MSNFFYGIANASTVAAHQAQVVASAEAAKQAHAVATAAKRMKAVSVDVLAGDETKVNIKFPNKDFASSFVVWCEHAAVVYQYSKMGDTVVVEVSMKEVKMTKEEFESITGHAPEHDDLDRVNCPQTGTAGHRQCGICSHGKPAFLHCPACYERRQKLEKWGEQVRSTYLLPRRYFYANLRWGIHVNDLSELKLVEQAQKDLVDDDVVIDLMNYAAHLGVGECCSYTNGFLVRLKDDDSEVVEICGHVGPSHNCALPKGHRGGHRPSASWGTQEW